MGRRTKDPPSPEANMAPDNETFVKLVEEIKALRNAVNDMTTKFESATTQNRLLTGRIETLEEQNATLETELQEAKNEIVTLRSQATAMQNKLVQLEAYGRRENLIFYGIAQSAEENCINKLRSVMKDIMGIENSDAVKFDRCHRLNSKSQPQPIICRFNWSMDRQTVWSKRNKLKDSGISLSEDFPQQIVADRKSLYPIMMHARNLKRKSYMFSDKLVVDGQTYTTHNLHTLPPELNPASVATRKLEDVTAFFSKASPLSNFYEVDLKLDGKKFSSVEQYLQYCKALHAEKPCIAQKILASKSPAECKRLGDGITLDIDDWRPHATNCLLNACNVKFTTNLYAKNFLKNTGNTCLAEASNDLYWGIGLTLKSKDLNDKTKWTGANEFGKILMKVSEWLKD